MSLSIRPVDTNYVSQTWPYVKKYIDESQEKGLVSGSADYNSDHVLSYLTSGQWMLIVAVDDDNQIHGAMTLSFINYPMNRVAFVTTTGGKMIINKETFEQLKRIAKHHGATKIQAMARPSMVKLLKTCGMQPCNILVESTI